MTTKLLYSPFHTSGGNKKWTRNTWTALFSVISAVLFQLQLDATYYSDLSAEVCEKRVYTAKCIDSAAALGAIYGGATIEEERRRQLDANRQLSRQIAKAFVSGVRVVMRRYGFDDVPQYDWCTGINASRMVARIRVSYCEGAPKDEIFDTALTEPVRFTKALQPTEYSSHCSNSWDDGKKLSRNALKLLANNPEANLLDLARTQGMKDPKIEYRITITSPRDFNPYVLRQNDARCLLWDAASKERQNSIFLAKIPRELFAEISRETKSLQSELEEKLKAVRESNAAVRESNAAVRRVLETLDDYESASNMRYRPPEVAELEKGQFETSIAFAARTRNFRESVSNKSIGTAVTKPEYDADYEVVVFDLPKTWTLNREETSLGTYEAQNTFGAMFEVERSHLIVEELKFTNMASAIPTRSDLSRPSARKVFNDLRYVMVFSYTPNDPYSFTQDALAIEATFETPWEITGISKNVGSTLMGGGLVNMVTGEIVSSEIVSSDSVTGKTLIESVERVRSRLSELEKYRHP